MRVIVGKCSYQFCYSRLGGFVIRCRLSLVVEWLMCVYMSCVMEFA